MMIRNIYLLINIPVLVMAVKTEEAGETKGTGKKEIHVAKKHVVKDFIGLFGSFYHFFTDSDVDFGYFATHDLDDNKKLDGLELFIALRHEAENQTDDHELEDDVDSLLLEYDVNNDGFLDFREFKKVEKTRLEEDSHEEGDKEIESPLEMGR